MCHLMGKCVCAFGGDCGVFDSSGFQKALGRERLRKNSSSKVSCASLLKRSQGSFLEGRDQLAVEKTLERRLQVPGGGSPCSPAWLLLADYPWVPEILCPLFLLDPLPAQVSFVEEHWINLASKPGTRAGIFL